MAKRRRRNNTDKASLFQYYWRLLATAPQLKALEVRNKEHGGELLFAQEFNGRMWRYDWAILEVKTAVEVDGGRVMCRYSPKQNRHIAVGHHNTNDDLEKSNTALELGWAVFHFSPEMLNKDPEHCIEQVVAVISHRLLQQNT